MTYSKEKRMASIKKEIGNALAGIIQTAQEKQIKDNGDYLQDGLIYCGKCDTPKECKISFLGAETIVPCLCKCGLKEREDTERFIAEETRRVELQNRRGECFDNSSLWNYTFEKCKIKDDPLYETCVKYAENFEKMTEEGQGLMFFGDVGNGKTYLAASIANELLEKGYTCRMTNFATITMEMQDFKVNKAAYVRELMNNDLLVIDDLASERDTEFMNENVLNIINRRYQSRKPLIVTTNLTADELKNPKDISKKRLYSRLMEMTIPISVHGKDMRREELKEKYNKFKELLHLPGKE